MILRSELRNNLHNSTVIVNVMTTDYSQVAD